MVKPVLSVRLVKDYHPLVRCVARRLNRDSGFAAHLKGLLASPATARSQDGERLGSASRSDRNCTSRAVRNLERRVAWLERQLPVAQLVETEELRPQSEVHQLDRQQVKSEADRKQTSKLKSRQRLLAERLVMSEVPDGWGGKRVLTRAEIERQLIERLAISRNAAQSAASKAVSKLDPDNPARRTHKTPVARKVNAGLIAKMRGLATSGHTRRQIADIIGADVKTVGKYLNKKPVAYPE